MRRAGAVSPLSVCVRRPPTWGERGPSAPCLCAFDGHPTCGERGASAPPVSSAHPTVADMRRAGAVSPLSVRNRRSPTCGERGPSAPCLCAIDGRRHAASGGRQPPVCNARTDGRRHAASGAVSPLSVCNRRSPTCGERGASAPCLCAIGSRRRGASGGRQPPVCVRSTAADMRRAGPSAPCLCAIGGRRRGASLYSAKSECPHHATMDVSPWFGRDAGPPTSGVSPTVSPSVKASSRKLPVANDLRVTVGDDARIGQISCSSIASADRLLA